MIDTWVYPPSTQDEIDASVALYSNAGFPGCISSMDGVHLAWARAPHADRWQFIGTQPCADVFLRARENENEYFQE